MPLCHLSGGSNSRSGGARATPIAENLMEPPYKFEEEKGGKGRHFDSLRYEMIYMAFQLSYLFLNPKILNHTVVESGNYLINI